MHGHQINNLSFSIIQIFIGGTKFEYRDIHKSLRDIGGIVLSLLSGQPLYNPLHQGQTRRNV